MKLVFNDATTITVQQVIESGGMLTIKTAGTPPEQLRDLFSDPVKTKRITVEERGQIVEEYENYTEFYRTEEYTGKIYGVVVNQIGKSTVERLTEVEGDMQVAQKDIEDLKAGGVPVGIDMALYAASVVVARAQAQSLTDEQALQAKALYGTFGVLAKEGYVAEKKGYKFTHDDILYKTAQDNLTFQSHYPPGEGTESLYTRIDETHAGTLEDPIPYAGNMELEEGKYYTQDGVTYLCNRYTGQAVFQPLKDLIGIYVEKVEEE